MSDLPRCCSEYHIDLDPQYYKTYEAQEEDMRAYYTAALEGRREMRRVTDVDLLQVTLAWSARLSGCAWFLFRQPGTYKKTVPCMALTCTSCLQLIVARLPAGAGGTSPLSAAADTLVGLAMGRTVIQAPLSTFCMGNH